MTSNVSVKSALNRVIAQGEDFPIFFRLFPTPSSERLDSVWFQTDEDEVTEVIDDPPYGQTCQLIYPSSQTMKFSTGDHHIRLWGRIKDREYVITELVVSVNPAFPFTSTSTDIDYVYRPNVVNTTYVQEGEADIVVQTYTGRLVNTAQWSHNTYDVDPGEPFPTEAQVGDMVCLNSIPQIYYICVKDSPVEWQPLSSNVNFDQIILTSDYLYIECQPFEITEQ